MPKKKPSALDALTRLNEERRVLETRGAEARRAAALELGLAVLDAGGATLGMARLRELVIDAVAGEKPAPGKGDRDLVREKTAAAPAPSGEGSHG